MISNCLQQLLERNLLEHQRNQTNNIPSNIQFIDKNNELIILNRRVNTIQFYDFKDGGKETKRIILEKEGNNGVGNISDFLVHTQDSIFVLDAPMFKLSLVNSNGKLLFTYNLFDKRENAKNATPSPFPFTPIVMLDNKIYISSTPLTQALTKYYELKGCVIIVDLKTKNISHKYGFPEVYKKNIYPSMLTMFHRTYSPKHKKFVHSFMADHHIQVTDYETNMQYLANSKQLEAVEILKKEVTDPTENNKVTMQTAIFWGIYYDKFRDIFYRSFILNDKDNSKKTGLIILNTDFQRIGEVEKVPQENTLPIMPLFTKEGMWLLNTKGKEGFITYDLFELVKK